MGIGRNIYVRRHARAGTPGWALRRAIRWTFYDLSLIHISFVGEPVHLDEQVLYPVKNYGSAVTPFYTNLALWVGGFVRCV